MATDRLLAGNTWLSQEELDTVREVWEREQIILDWDEWEQVFVDPHAILMQVVAQWSLW